MRANNTAIADPVIQSFSRRIKSVVGDNLVSLCLFGSRARGENHAHSDYDFLIVLDQKTEDIVDAIRDVEVEILNQYESLVSALIMPGAVWDFQRGMPLGITIERDGIYL